MTTAALLHPSRAALAPPQRRCLQLPCRAEQQQAGSGAAPPSRRAALLLLPTAAAALAAAASAPRPAAAAAEVALDTAQAVGPALDVATWPMWVDRTFSFSYPKGLLEVQDLTFAAPPRARAGQEQATENPLKAEVRSEDGRQKINVVVSQAATFKRTFLQVTDISQLGDPKAVARLLLPPGATVVSYTSAAVAQPAKDTGTVLGVIERDPITYYTYEVVLPDADQTRIALTAAAQLGRIYIMGAQAPGVLWAECGAGLTQAARSFRLRYKV